MSKREKRVAAAATQIADRLFRASTLRVGCPRAKRPRGGAFNGWYAEPLERRVMLSWTGATSGTNKDASHDYNNIANWASGVIDDSFDGVTLTGNATLYFTADHTTPAAGLNLNYTGNADLTLISDSSTPRTLTLGGNISGNFGGANTRTVTIGDAASPLDLQAGGVGRSYQLSTGDHLQLVNPVFGGIVAQGNTAVGFGDRDFDTNSVSGGAFYDGNTWTINGNSENTDTEAEQGNLVYTPITDDFVAVVHIAGYQDPQGMTPWQRGELLVRNGTGPLDSEVGLVSTENGLFGQAARLAPNTWFGTGSTGWDAQAKWMKIVRHGSIFSTFDSHDGQSWTAVGQPISFAMSDTVMVGMAVNSSASMRASIQFDDFSVLSGSGPVSGWADAEVGDTHAVGVSDFGQSWQVLGAGLGASATSDDFHLVSTTGASDGNFIARVTAQTSADAQAAAGITLRANESATASGATLSFTPSHTVLFQTRDGNGTFDSVSVPNINGQIWLNLRRGNGTVSGFYSTNGSTWTQIGAATNVELGASTLAGLCVSSNSSTATNLATFANVDLTPAGWTGMDIGSPALSGTSWFDGTTWHVTGGGNQIYGTSDEFHYTSTTTANATIQAQFLGSTSQLWPQTSGLMFRATSAADSPFVNLIYMPQYGLELTWRDGTSQSGSTAVAQTAVNLPVWLRLVRHGNHFSGYYSTNGSSYSLLATHDVVMPNTVETGLAVSSVNDGEVVEADFSNVSVTDIPTALLSITATGPFSGFRHHTTTVTLPFTDTDPLATDTATIDWGDGTASSPDVTNTTVVEPANGQPGMITATHIYDTAATYQPILTLTNNDDSSRSVATLTVTVSDHPPTVVNAATAIVAADGRTIALSSLGADDLGDSNLIYAWTTISSPAGASAPVFSINNFNSSKDTTATINDTGNYSFEVTITNPAGLSVTSDVAVTVTQQESNGLVGWWKLDDGSGSPAIDSSGNNDTGTLVNDPTWSGGRIGHGLTLNGAAQGVDLNNPNDLSLPSTMTLSAWVNPTNHNPWQRVIAKLASDDSPENDNYVLGVGDHGGIYFGVFQNGVQTYISGETPITLNCWNLITATYDGTTGHIYLNGTLQPESFNLTSDLDNSSGDAHIGYGSSSDFAFHGIIDDARIYNRALSTSEVRDLYVLVGPTLNVEAGDGQATLSWSAIPDASGYNIYRSTVSGREGATPYQSNVSATSFDDTGSTNGSSYFYTVAAVVDGVEGIHSNEVSAIPHSSEIIHFNFDEGSGTTALDSASNHTATIPTGANWARGAVGSSSVAFNGTGGLSASASNLPIGDADRTVSCWFKTSTDFGYQGLVGYGSADYNGLFGLLLSGNRLCFTQYGDSITAGPNVVDGQWHHVAVTCDSGGSWTVYLDGASIGNSRMDTNTTDGPLTVGNVAGYSFSGDIDDVRVFNRVLSNTEIETMAGRSSDSSPILHFGFDEGTGTTTTDDSGNTTATLHDGVGWDSGRIGNSSLAISNSELPIPATGLPVLSNPRTISCWFKTTTEDQSEHSLVAYGQRDFGRDVELLLYGNQLCITQYGDAIIAGPDVADDEWHLATTTYAGGVWSLYLDGSLLASKSMDTSTPDGGLHVGGASQDTGYNGNIDDVRVYDRALSASEIQSLYGAADDSPPTVTAVPSVPLVQSNVRFRIPLSNFTQPNVTNGEYTASVNWGDDSSFIPGTTVATVENVSGTYRVVGEHQYAMPGTYTLVVRVTDAQGSTGSVSETLTVVPLPTPFVVPGAAGTNTTMTFSRTGALADALYRNELGMFEVSDQDFSVGGQTPAFSDFSADYSSYTHAALSDPSSRVIFSTTAHPGDTDSVTLPAGTMIDFYMVQDASTDNYLTDTFPANYASDGHFDPQLPQNGRPNVFFFNAAANWDHFQHFVRLVDGSFGIDESTDREYGIEDTTGGGDQDFNDVVFSLNAAPNTISIAPIAPIITTTHVSANLAAIFTDTASSAIHTATIDWGDGSTSSPDVTNGVVFEPSGNAAGNVSAQHIYTNQGIYTAKLFVAGSLGGSTEIDVAMTVIPGVVAITPNHDPYDATVAASSSYDATFTDTDPVTTHTATIAWGDGASSSTADGTITIVEPANGQPGRISANHTFATAGNYTLDLHVTSAVGGSADVTPTAHVTSQSQSPSTVPVTVTLGSSITSAVNEGDTTTFNAEVIHPRSDNYSFVWSITLNGQAFSDPSPLAYYEELADSAKTRDSIAFRVPDNGNYIVTVTATADDQLSGGSATSSFVAGNIAPSGSLLSLTPSTLTQDSSGSFASFDVRAKITDPGDLDTFTYEWHLLKDGVAIGMTGADLSDPREFKYQPTLSGNYVLSCFVTDKDGGTCLLSGLNFLVTTTVGNEVKGSVQYDYQPGIIQPSPISDATVYDDVNGNSRYDLGEPFAITDVNGNYDLQAAVDASPDTIRLNTTGTFRTFNDYDEDNTFLDINVTPEFGFSSVPPSSFTLSPSTVASSEPPTSVWSEGDVAINGRLGNQPTMLHVPNPAALPLQPPGYGYDERFEPINDLTHYMLSGGLGSSYFAQDGTLYYTRYSNDDTGGLYSVTPDGTQEADPIIKLRYAEHIAIDDGGNIYLSANDAGNTSDNKLLLAQGIYKFDKNGSVLAHLIPGMRVDEFALLPDGHTIIFHQGEGNNKGTLYRLDTNTGEIGTFVQISAVSGFSTRAQGMSLGTAADGVTPEIVVATFDLDEINTDKIFTFNLSGKLVATGTWNDPVNGESQLFDAAVIPGTSYVWVSESDAGLVSGSSGAPSGRLIEENYRTGTIARAVGFPGLVGAQGVAVYGGNPAAQTISAVAGQVFTYTSAAGFTGPSDLSSVAAVASYYTLVDAPAGANNRPCHWSSQMDAAVCRYVPI